MTRIAHLTDLHFGATDPAVVAALVAALNADPPDLLAISGDLTQGARRSEFRAARAFIDSIAAPALMVPGNHDITPYKLLERFFDPYRRWRQEIGDTQPVWRDGRVGVVGLNTARRAGLSLDWSRGRITGGRLARALSALDALPQGLVRIVVAHHPLLLPEAGSTATVVGGATRALAAFGAHGVRLVLAGHLHVSYDRVAGLPGAGPIILQGGSATSTRLRGEPNAYNLLTVGADGAIALEAVIWTDGRWVRGGPGRWFRAGRAERRLGRGELLHEVPQLVGEIDIQGWIVGLPKRPAHPDVQRRTGGMHDIAPDLPAVPSSVSRLMNMEMLKRCGCAGCPRSRRTNPRGPHDTVSRATVRRAGMARVPSR